MDPRRLADVRAGTDARAESSGSGYLIGPRLVLTAHHVIATPRGPWPRITVRIGHPNHGALAHRKARVCWSGIAEGESPSRSAGWDVALLELDEPIEVEQLVRWGRPTGTQQLAYTGVGYPRLAEYEDSVRGVEQLGGMIPPQATGPGGTLVLDQGAGPRLRPSGERAWGGASGAAVFCNGLLVGVVAKDDEEFENLRLHATPTWSFVDDQQFVEHVRCQTGAVPVVEPVELADSLDCRIAPITAVTPGSLLAAAAETVDFHGRDDEWEELTAWRDGKAPLSVKLVTGDGGQGKSRLAREFLRSSGAAGWVAGLTEAARAVDERTARSVQNEGEQQQRAQRLVEQLADCTADALLVCDYAEVHPVFVETLVNALAERTGRHRVRVLLLSRAPGAWWQDLVSLLGKDASRLPLKELGVDDSARRRAYEAAVTGLAGRLAHLPQSPIDQEPVAPWPLLARQLISSPPRLGEVGNALTLQMIALLDLLQVAAGRERTIAESPDQRLVEHERAYLYRAAAAKGLLDPGVLSRATATDRRRQEAFQALDRALAGLIVLGPCDAHTAHRLGGLASNNHADDVVDWLAALYPPQSSQGLTTGQVQPDRLAEHLLGRILTHTNQLSTRVHAELLPQIALLSEDLETAQSALFALVRTAAHQQFRTVVSQDITQLIRDHPDPFAAAASFLAAVPDHRSLLLDSLRHLAHHDPAALSTQAWRASQALPRMSISLAFFSAAVTEILTGLFAQLADGNPDAYLPDLAMSLNNHALRLAEVGRRNEAVIVSEEALRLRRELADSNRNTYLPDLAMSLNNHAARLAEVGRRNEAVPVSEEALRLRRELADSNRNTYLPDLAMSLNNHALRLAEVGRRNEAVPLSEETVRHYQQLADSNRNTYLPDLATALNNHALRLAEVGRRNEAVIVSEETVRLRRELADSNRDAYLPDLATALNNHVLRLAEMGRRNEAVPVSEEALRLRRELADSNRDAYVLDLATSLNNHGVLLAEVGRRNEAVPVSEEAVQLRRELADSNRDAYLPDLAMSLNNHAALLAEVGRRNEAVPVSEEAVRHYQQLADSNRDTYLPELAAALTNHAARLAEMGRRNEAVPVSEEAVQLRRELADSNRDAYLHGLAMSLNNHAALLAGPGRNEAVLFSEEAVRHYQQLADSNRDTYLPDLATALTNHAARLAEMGRRNEAVSASEEAVRLSRELTDSNGDAYLPNLVQSLSAFGYVLLELSFFSESVAPLAEALLLVAGLPYAQELDERIVYFLRIAYSGDPLGVTRMFRAITGHEVPAWMSDGLSEPDNPDGTE
ncbi:tetratricopeptide repeat protein [Streptomyces canus]|uniref:tetratricopeptide repeat protein n=1 Tax=Streptomyces canus TaxID=58343 RepID=UPI0033B67582